jgi:predicted nucleic acid-binding protein
MRNKDYLLDTNIAGYLVELKSGKLTEKCKNLQGHLENISADAKLFVSSISIGELHYGFQVAPSHMKDDIKKLCDYFINNLDIIILDVNENTARDYYATIRAKLFNQYSPKDGRKKKRPEEWENPSDSKSLTIQENDIWISAIAQNYNLILVSNDKMNAIKAVVGADLDCEDWLS